MPASGLSWPTDPNQNLPLTPDGGFHGGPTIVADGVAGAIIPWYGADASTQLNIYAQRVSADGDTLWPMNGVPVDSTTGDQMDPQAVSDGEGGAIIAWTDTRNGNEDIYAQRIDPLGAPLWSPGGIVITNAPGTAPAGHNGHVLSSDQSRRLGSGVYFVRVKAGALVGTRKIVLTR